MQDRFANRDKTGTDRLSGREVLIVGWLVCLGKREFPVDPHRDPRTEKPGRKQWNRAYPRVWKSHSKPVSFHRKPAEDGPIQSSHA